MSVQAFKILLSDVRSCTQCKSELSNGVRPIVQCHPDSRVLIAGQAPGAKVHSSGLPFDDASGDRLREWMGIDKALFYDETRIAILPMGFCYPGKGKSGDLPPQSICAKLWRKELLASLSQVQLTLVIGQYAQAWHLPFQQKTLTATVQDWSSYDKSLLPLPHPSPRNNTWLKRNAWFVNDVLPELKRRVSRALD